LMILIILGEEYRLWNSSLCSFLQPPVTLYVFGPNIPILFYQYNYVVFIVPFLSYVFCPSQPPSNSGYHTSASAFFLLLQLTSEQSKGSVSLRYERLSSEQIGFPLRILILRISHHHRNH
jgi:hypothetical protein